MPWLETDVRDQRIQFVLTARQPGANVSAVCRAFRISRKTGYKWLRREAAAHSVAVLADQSRRPRRSPTRTSAAVVAQVGHLRERYGWGGEKLAVILRHDGLIVTPRTIDRIIQREGWTHADAAHAPAPHRFARAHPNELWQMDAKGAYPLAAGGRCHALSVLDDCSRFAVSLTALPTLDTRRVQRALIRSFERYGLPEAVLMDHGAPWWSTRGPAGLTRLGVFLLKQGIRLIFGAVRHPQTQGKVERFHRTLGAHLRWTGVPTTLPAFATALAGFEHEYNYIRPHAALAQQPPARCYHASGRLFRPRPRPWIYAPGADIRRVHGTGQIMIGRRLYFVSEALQGEDVACIPHDDRLLVGYRHMFVRELRPRTGQSLPLMQPIDRLPLADSTADVLPMS